MDESTRVMPAGGVPMDRTMVAGAPIMATPAANATQMGVRVTCPVCANVNSGMEKYCCECGFVLASTPGEAVAQPQDVAPTCELVEASSGRVFALKPGANIVGRENCDILLMDGTVSRRHAQIGLEDGAITVTDLGSTNGTQVNGSPISANTPTALNPGDTVKFGNAMLTLPGAPAEATILPTPQALPAPEPTLMAEPAPLITGEVDEATAPEAPTVEPEAAATVSDADDEGLIARFAPTNDTTMEIPLVIGTLTIGRRVGNDIVVGNDPYISGNHARIDCNDTGCYLTDVGSTNGTTVNGSRLAPNQTQPLVNGDEIVLGQQSYRFESLIPKAPAPAPHAVLLNEGDEA